MTVKEYTIADDLRNTELGARIAIAKKVGKLLRRSNPADHRAALELAQILVEDTSISVRKALAEEVKSCIFLPEKIAHSLGRDKDEISMPFLEVSEAVDDAFLEEIVRQCGEALRAVIAGRKDISEFVSFAICDVGAKESVSVLLQNETADISKRAGERVVERFPSESGLLEKLAERADLPVSVAQQIIFKVSQAYGKYLTERFQLAEDYSSYLMSLSRNQVFTHVLDVAPLSEIENYFLQLRSAGGLNSDCILHYLQQKNTRLFIACVAAISNTSFKSAQEKIGYHNPTALSALLRKGGTANSVIGVLLIAYERLFRG